MTSCTTPTTVKTKKVPVKNYKIEVWPGREIPKVFWYEEKMGFSFKVKPTGAFYVFFNVSRYTDDVHVEGALKGYVFRAPVAHGDITASGSLVRKKAS